MTHFAEHWGGVCLAGEYTLERFLRAADDTGGDGALFEARNNAGETVLLKLVSAANPEERLFLWRRTEYLQHPNLLRVLDCGTSEEYIYSVLERPDDILATALEQGPLEEREARDFLVAARVRGERSLYIILVEIVPTMTSLLAASFLALAVFEVGFAASLQFLGLGNSSELMWGTMLYNAQQSAALEAGNAWWALAPGAAVALMGAGFALLNYAFDEIGNPALRPVRRRQRRGRATA